MSNYTVEFEEEAFEFLMGLTQKQQDIILGAIDLLETNPHPGGCKRLKGITSNGMFVWRIRKGDHRVLYTIEQGILKIVVIEIGDRKDIYE